MYGDDAWRLFGYILMGLTALAVIGLGSIVYWIFW